MFKTLTLIVTVAFSMGLAASTAQAQIPVTDAGEIAQTLQIFLNAKDQLDKLKSQLDNQRQMLASIDPSTFSGLRQLLSQGQLTYAMLQGDLDSVSFNINAVNRDFARVFPNKKQAQWSNARYSDFNAYYDGWNSEIATASQAAVHAQANISTLDANNRQIAIILGQANDASSGEVRQLQLVNQQLALIHSELGSLVQTLGTTGRVLTEWTAGSVGEKMMARERDRRRLDGYTSRGQPSRVLNRLP